MQIPKPKLKLKLKPNKIESKREFQERCISILIKEGIGYEKALEMSNKTWFDNKRMFLLDGNKEKAIINRQTIKK